MSIESKSILYAPEKASARVGVLSVGAGLRNSEAPTLNIKREPTGSQIASLYLKILKIKPTPLLHPAPRHFLLSPRLSHLLPPLRLK